MSIHSAKITKIETVLYKAKKTDSSESVFSIFFKVQPQMP